MRVKVVSVAKAVPPAVETAADLAPRLGRSPDWIVARTGVRRRHVAQGDVACLGAQASRDALAGGPPPDVVLNASALPRQVLPEGGVFVARLLGLSGVPCFGVQASCLSFLVAFHQAALMVSAGAARRALVFSADFGTRGRNFDEPESAALLGDGAAAAVLESTPEGEPSALLSWRMGTWPEGADLTEVRGGGLRFHPNSPDTRPEDNLFHMDGPQVFRLAARYGPALVHEAVAAAGLRLDDIDLVVPHQASGRGLQLLGRAGFPDSKVVNVVADYGNCVAASVPLALAVAEEEGRLRRGDRVLLCGTGAGFSAAAAVLRW